jgi:Spy/CpxP family protein refolding chaperone
MKNSLTAACLALAIAAPFAASAQDKKAAPATPAPATAPTAANPAMLSSAELRARIQSDKKGIIQRNLPLTEKEAKDFWPIYDKYEQELAGPQAVINRSIIDYVNAGTNITDANAKRIVDQILKAQVNEAKIRQTQFAKVSKVLPAAKAARFIQLENKMRSVILYETASAIPLVP